MSAKIIQFPGITTVETTAESVLGAASKAGIARVLVIGVIPDGTEYAASSTSDARELLWFIERVKAKLLAVREEDFYA